MIGFILFTVFLYAGSAYGQCNPEGVLGCTQDYLQNIRGALGDGSGQGMDVAGICRHTKTFLDCAKRHLRDCGPDIKNRMDQQLGDAESKLQQYGCNPDGTYSGGAQGGGSMAGCDQSAIAGCMQQFATDVRNRKKQEEMCDDYNTVLACVRNGMQGCPQEVKDQFEQQLSQSTQQFLEQCKPDCNQGAIWDCIQQFTSDVKDGSRQEEEICHHFSKMKSCTSNRMQGCTQEVKGTFEKEIKKMYEPFVDKCKSTDTPTGADKRQGTGDSQGDPTGAGCAVKNSAMMLIAAIFLSFFIFK